jgi:hypothetical protein
MQNHFNKIQCRQKGFILPIVIVVVIVAILGAGGYFAYKQYVAPKSETPADQIAGWKTYNETDFGFSFKYPATWIIDDGLTLNTCCLDIFNYDPSKKQGQFQEKGEVKIQIANYKKSVSSGLKEFVSSQTYMESNTKATSVQEVDIAGINGIKSNLIGDGIYYLPRSSTEGISITIFNHPESGETLKETVSQILSTFKFTTPADQTAGPALSEVEGWKTYTNTQYGFEIKIPPIYSLREQNNKVSDYVRFYRVDGGQPASSLAYLIGIKERINSLDDLGKFMQTTDTTLPLPGAKLEDTVLGGRKAVQFSHISYAGGYTGTVYNTGVLLGDGFAVIISMQENATEQEYFKMLSTFKFTK